MASIYQRRDYRPVWFDDGRLRPQAWTLAALASGAAADGLDPHRYAGQTLAARLAAAQSGDRHALAETELALSRVFVDYFTDLHRPREGAALVRTDPRTPSTPAVDAALAGITDAASLRAQLAALRRMHPIYESLRAALGAPNPPATKAIVRANLERARALPADPGRRYILVDAAAARLWLYEDGRAVDSMAVVAGMPDQPTPMMAGLIRYVVINPYWNVPPDLVRDRVAPAVLREGPAELGRRDMEALADWTPNAALLDPAAVDWPAVASGRTELRVRQRPGPDNMMGAVKFMFPNRFGVYLHDTPMKADFDRAERHLSAGCVRLEDAARLQRWLFGAPTAAATQGERRLDLPRPVPVYITYFTAMPTADGRLERRTDVYGRDPPLIARLNDARAPAATPQLTPSTAS